MQKILNCLVVALLATTMMVAGASGAMVEYNMFIDGNDDSSQVLDPGSYMLTVEVIVTDNDLTGDGFDGGLLQSAFDLSDTAGVIKWADVTGGFPPGTPNGLWDSAANAAFDSHFQGTLVDAGMKAIAETGAIAPGNFVNKVADIGANVWSMVAEGMFEYDGSLTELQLTIAAPYGGDILVTAFEGGGIVGAIPQGVEGDSIALGVPEPATMALVGLGLIGFVAVRRRS